MVDGLGQLALLSEGIVGLDAEGLPVILARLCRLALLSERHAQVVESFGVFRPDLKSPPVLLDRLGRLALLYECLAPVGERFSIVRLDLEGPPEVLDRLAQPALPSERRTQVVVGFGILPDLERLLVVLDRLSQF